MPHKAGHIKTGQGGKPYKPKAGVTKKTPKATPNKSKIGSFKVEKINQGSKSGSKSNDRNWAGLNKDQQKTAALVSKTAQGLSEVAGHAAGRAAGSYSNKDYDGWWGENGSHETNKNPKKEENHGNYNPT